MGAAAPCTAVTGSCPSAVHFPHQVVGQRREEHKMAHVGADYELLQLAKVMTGHAGVSS